MKAAIIGVGNMGSKYARLFMSGEVDGATAGAFVRVKPIYQDIMDFAKEKDIPLFESGDALFDAVEKGELQIDGVVITTPHYSHEELTVKALQKGISVLVDKPLGVHTLQARNMIAAAKDSKGIFAAILNQRTNPMYQKVKEIIASKRYGELKRVNWVVTDWYRPDRYFQNSGWHSTWATDGGGVLLNQCTHNLDLLQWMCGMPVRVQGFCHNGRFHNIEVEDDVTAYFEWENGANGTFISSTGDAPGVNRLEISLDEAMLVCENGRLRIGELEPEIGMKEKEYRATSTDFFKPLYGVWKEETFENVEDSYKAVMQNFIDVFCHRERELIAHGEEGINSLYLCNAVYLSAWEKQMVALPKSEAETENFEQRFYAHLMALSKR